jgi:collagenase-like PrtC family protease
MKYFSVPADFKIETLDKFDKLNKSNKDSRIIETYGNITVGKTFESGREADLLPKVNFARLSEYVQYARERNMDFSYTINSSYMQNKEFTPKGALEIMDLLSRLYDIGVRSLTIALPSLLEMVKAMKYDFKVKTSVICQITNANKAMFYKDMGVERIVVDESINRDFKTLKKIRRMFGDKVEMIVNVICDKNCIYRMFHYNEISGNSIEISNETGKEFYLHRCLLRRYKNIGNLLRLAWIRPEDIKYYTGIGINYFKLQGRDNLKKGNIAKAVEHYMKEDFTGNLLELIDIFGANSSFNVYIDNKKLDGFIQRFYQEEDFCQNNCTACGYCDSFAAKAIDAQKTRNVYENARRFHAALDKFKEMIDTLNKKNHGETPQSLDASFDIE